MTAQTDPTRSHRFWGRLFRWLCTAAALFGCLVLAALLAAVVWQAWGWLNWEFLTRYDSRRPTEAGIKAALWGSFWLLLLTALFAVPLSISAAIYLEEYARRTRLTALLQLNVNNLAGVPSIVIGILGLTAFVRMFGLFGNQPRPITVGFGPVAFTVQIPFGRSVLAGALTLALLIMPVLIVATQEALRAVPASIRHAALALGASRWQTIRYQVLPAAAPGILTGVILALSRAVGETAPLLMIGALSYVAFSPGGIERLSDLLSLQKLAGVPFSPFTVLPIQIFNWALRPQSAYHHLAAAGIIVLLLLLFALNAAAIYLRYRFRRRLSGRT